eukprot:8516202-Pyramimonas_sp.AAC.1
MHVGVLDIHKAFDNVTLRSIIKAMLHRKYPVCLIRAIVEPMLDIIATFEFQNVCGGEVRYNKSVRTGGKEGPILFNIVLEAIWGSVIQTWDTLGYGVDWKGRGRTVLLYTISCGRTMLRSVPRRNFSYNR